jgi:hypothetical protein
MEQYLLFLLILLVGIPLLIASYSDYKTRKVPVKIWYPAVFVALPLAMIILGIDIWNGVINVTSAKIGILLTYLFQLANIFQFCIRQSCSAEADMISSERVKEYIDLKKEKYKGMFLLIS